MWKFSDRLEAMAESLGASNICQKNSLGHFFFRTSVRDSSSSTSDGTAAFLAAPKFCLFRRDRESCSFFACRFSDSAKNDALLDLLAAHTAEYEVDEVVH